MDLPDPDKKWPGDLGIRRGVILGVDAALTVGLLQPLPPEVSVVLTRFPDLNTTLLQRVSPDLVLAPLVSQDFDIMDLAQQLESCGYSGAVVAVTFPLPDRKIIEREVAASCDGIQLKIVEVD